MTFARRRSPAIQSRIVVLRRSGDGSHHSDRRLRCLLQINLDPASERPGRGGVLPNEIDDLAHAVDNAGMLELAGVMGVAPLGGDPVEAYRRLIDVSRRLQSAYPSATDVSAGMSDDFEVGIKAGATHVRVGSAVLGERLRNE